MKLLHPVTLAKLSNLRLRVQRVVEGVLSGLHSSPYKGHSLEFSQHREYAYGDELRHIDWKVYGRSDRFFIKQFQDETNLRAYLLLDASGSMGYRSQGSPGGLSKLDYASQLSAALAYLLLRQEDAVSLGVFDTSLRFFLPPRHQLSHFSLLCDKLETLAPGGETGIETVLKGFGRFMKRRGLVIVVSDLLADPAEVLKTLKFFRFRHHEVMVFHVLDPEEIGFHFSGEALFRHAENKEELFADADAIGEAYRGVFAKFLEEYKTGFRSAGIDYHLVTTDTPLETALARCMRGR